MEHRLVRSRSYILEKQPQQNHNESNTDASSDVDETLVKCAVECGVSNYDTSAAIDSLLDDNVSTLKEDVIDEIEQPFEKLSTTDETMHSKPETVPLSLNIDTNFNTFTIENLSPSFSLHTSPSLDALNDSRNQSLYFTPSSGRDFSSPTPSEMFPPARLIRSNSYVLEKPSPMLLKHMEANGVNVGSTPLKSPKSLNELRQNQTISNIPRKSFGSGDGLQIRDREQKINTPKSSRSVGNPMSTFANRSLNATVVPSNVTKWSPPSAAKVAKAPSLSARQKQSNQKIQTAQLNQSIQSNGSGVFKNNETILRSVYGSANSTKSKQPMSAKKMNAAAQQDLNKTSPNLKSNHGADTMTSKSSNNNFSAKNYQEIFEMIEQKHTAQMEALINRHRVEQQQMKEEFKRQQEELLNKISNLIANRGQADLATPNAQSILNSTSNTQVEEAKKSNEKMLIEDVNKEVPVTVDTNGNRVNKFTPDSAKCIRRLCYYDDNKLAADEMSKSYIIHGSYPSSLSTASSEQFEMYTIEEVNAATTIQAYVRGYLTRRLFRTTKVQTIVKTIHDTLVFLLDMHYENNQNETAADIKLKSHLIQQVIQAIGSK